MAFNKEAFFSYRDYDSTSVEVCGQTLYVRTLSAGDSVRYQSVVSDKGASEALPLLVVLAVCDEDGKRVFDEGDVEAISNKSPKTLETIVEAILSLNGITEDEIEAEKKD